LKDHNICKCLAKCVKPGTFITKTNLKPKEMGPTNLKDLGEVCVSVGEHGVDAVDGVLGLAGQPSFGFGLQYWQQNAWGSRKKITITNHRSIVRSQKECSRLKANHRDFYQCLTAYIPL